MTLFGQHYTLRPYQREAVDAAVSFLRGPAKHNAIEVLPTGSGKSLIIANIVAEFGAPVLIFQPSKEILDRYIIVDECFPAGTMVDGGNGKWFVASRERQLTNVYYGER